MNEMGRIFVLIGIPAYIFFELSKDWSETAPDPTRKSARKFACLGVCLAVVGSGFTNLANPIGEQIAAEVVMSALAFPVGYALGWIFTKL